jgi:cytochrome c oxidase subunit I
MSNGTAYLGDGKGFGAWFSTYDHKKIAMMFLGWTMGMFLFSGILAGYFKLMALRGDGVEQASLDRLLTYHGVIMVFMFLVPLIPSVMGYFLLPLQLGARDMAMPKFSRCSLRFYVVGVFLLLLSLIIAPVGTGWTFTTPYSLIDAGAFSLLAFGLFFMAMSWVFTGVNFLVTVHHNRAPGMGFFDMPILSWSLYLTSYVLVISGLLLGIVILYLAGAEASGRGLFSRQSSPLDWQNYFWFITTPAAFFAIIPAMGIITEVIVGISRKAVTGYRTVVGSMIALLAISFVTWGVHLVGMGQNQAVSFSFASLSLLTVIPVALIVYSWLATLNRGAVFCGAPTTYVVAFFLNGGIGAMLGLFLANMSVGSYLAATLFTTAHIHYLMMGGVLGAMMAGLYFWWPKFTGRLYNHNFARLGAILYVVGLNLAFFPQVIMGAKGLAQGAHLVPADLAGLQSVSIIGMGLLVLGFFTTLVNLVSSWTSGPEAPANPWGATTLEWTTDSPPPSDNFAVLPQAGNPYSF